MTPRRTTRRLALAALLFALVLLGAEPARSAARQEATPSPGFSCAAATPAVGTPAAGGATMEGMARLDPASPMAGMETEFDRLYIDMMIPHHAAILAMAQAALERLEDPRLSEIAEAIVAAQGPEIEELRGYRERFYGSPEPMPMDDRTMDMLAEAMPGMGSMPDQMMTQMDPPAQIAAFCAGADPDLAFIDLTVPHHESAVAVSRVALERAVHPEIREVAQRVIDAQEREVAELNAIRAEMTTTASPAAN